MDNEDVKKTSFEIYDMLNAAGIDTIIDDRQASAGVKFADADLFGMPLRLVISPKALDKNQFEVVERATGKVHLVEKENLVDFIRQLVADLKESGNLG